MRCLVGVAYYLFVVAVVWCTNSNFGGPSKCSVYLTVSLEANVAEKSFLEIHWDASCSSAPITWIGLFDQDPSLHAVQSTFAIQINDSLSGSATTNTQLGRLHLPGGWDRDTAIQNTSSPNSRSPVCLPFYVAAFDKLNTIQSMNCLKLQPNWMVNMPDLWALPLKELFLPGTHCSGSFPIASKTDYTPLYQWFGFSQNFNIWTQLVMGIRHLELHIGYRSSANADASVAGFWVMNENLYINPLSEILPDIRQFVRLTGEMVVVDVREIIFDGTELHAELVGTIASHLGDYAFGRDYVRAAGGSNSYDVTMQQMRAQGRMILITYNELNVVKENTMLWLPWTQFSTANLELCEYLEYLRQVFRRQSVAMHKNTGVGWSLVATQSLESAYYPNSSMLTQRQRAAAINSNVTSWISGPWSQTVNVMSMDFVWSTNLIDLAIYTNSQKRWTSGSENLSKIEVPV